MSGDITLRIEGNTAGVRVERLTSDPDLDLSVVNVGRRGMAGAY